MLKLICVEFKKLRRRREVLFMLLAAFIMPAVSLFYFYTHRDMLTDIGLYKQAILSFNIFLILPALLEFYQLLSYIENRLTMFSNNY